MSQVIVCRLNDLKLDEAAINPIRSVYISQLKGKRQQASLTAWMILKRLALENYSIDIDKVSLTYNNYGKPFMEGFEFSVSHSKDLVAVAVSDQPIGIDIQCIEEKDYSKLAKYFNADSHDNQNIIAKFSAAEAFYKRKGTGIRLHDKEVIPTIFQKIIQYKNYPYILSIDSSDECNIIFDDDYCSYLK